MNEQRKYGGGGSDAYYAVKELEAENKRLREELEERRKWGESWCDKCALYYSDVNCPECRLGEENARLWNALWNIRVCTKEPDTFRIAVRAMVRLGEKDE